MPKDNKHRDGKKTNGYVQAAVRAIQSNSTIAALAMKGVTRSQKIVLYACYGIILIGIFVLVIPPYEVRKELTAFALVVVPLFVVAIVALLQSQEPSRKNDVSPVVTLTSHLRIVQLSPVVFDRVRDVLSEARIEVFKFLRTSNPNLLDEQVRANIFFPEYGPSGDPDDYVLKICPGLHFKMDHPPELGIVFRPGQGATGNVFVSRQPRVTQRLTSASGSRNWDTVYEITNELVAIIHPDMRWIISMPLEGMDKKSLGVMNVDGLRYQFDIDLLYECIAKMTYFVIIISKLVEEEAQ